MRKLPLVIAGLFLAFLPASNCGSGPGPKPVPVIADAGPAPVVDAGGSSSVTTATGGNNSNVGGQEATGGTSSCPTISQLTQQSGKDKLAKPKHHKLSGWRPSHNPQRAKSTLERIKLKLTSVICSVLHNGPDFCLDQDVSPFAGNKGQPTGSCTGNAGVGMISYMPLTVSTHYNETDAQLAYQGGTCKENGCKTPCTCASCPAAFCPQTGANDNGSMGSSVDEWMVEQGWIKGYSTADTVNALIAGVQISACELGSNFDANMMNTDSNCQIHATGAVQGGHEYVIDGYYPNLIIAGKVVPSFEMRNSWGDTDDGLPWGCCRKNPAGTLGCGRAYLSVSDVQLLFTQGAEGNCPDL